jgi:hypothetical protein
MPETVSVEGQLPTSPIATRHRIPQFLGQLLNTLEPVVQIAGD